MVILSSTYDADRVRKEIAILAIRFSHLDFTATMTATTNSNSEIGFHLCARNCSKGFYIIF